MSPRKAKANRTIEEDATPTIAINMDELEAKIRENAEELEKTQDTAVKEHRKTGSSSTERLQQKIDKIMAEDGVVGYILRNSTSASINLKDPKKVTEYALLSSSTVEASAQLLDSFKLGDVKQMLVEGRNAKLLFFTAKDHKVSILMEKSVDHNWVGKTLLG